MRNKREKNYWLKKTERFSDNASAKTRAGYLRMQEHVSHVTVSKNEEAHLVQYSVAKWYMEELEQAGLKL